MNEKKIEVSYPRYPTKKRKAAILRYSIILCSLFILSVIGISTLALDRIKRHILEDFSDSLQTLLKATEESAHHWAKDKKNYAELWASSPTVRTLAGKLLAVPRSRKALLASPAQAEIRLFFREKLRIGQFLGIFLIAPDHISIASMRDENVGILNLISEMRRESLEKAFDGAVVMVPPIPSDVPLPDPSGKMIAGYPTMFVAAPVRDDSGAVIAVFTVRINPMIGFRRLARLGRVGKTGETYFFDRRGRMLTASRFEDQLRRIGLLGPHQSSILNIKLRDPGGNLLEGHLADLPESQQPLTLMARMAVNGNSGKTGRGYRDYRGVPVIGAWIWEDEHLGGIGIATEVDVEQALVAYNRTRAVVMGVLTVTVVLSMTLALTLVWVRKRDEEELIASNILLQTVFDAIPEHVFVKDTNSKFIMANHKFKDDFKIDFTDLDSTEIPNIPLKKISKIIEEDRQIIRTGETLNSPEVDVVLPDGSTAYFKKQKVPLRDENGNIIGIVGCNVNITERKVAEKELQMLAAAVEQVAEGVVITDVEGIIQYVNPAFEQVTGYSREEVLGKNPNLLSSRKQDEKFYKSMWQTILSGKAWQGLITNRKKDGSLYDEEMAISPIRNEAGGIINFVAVKRDVTKERKMESELHQARKMEALGVLAGGIAHDFNNILTPIISYTELAEMQIKPDSKVHKHLKAIMRGALRARDLVARILLFSRRSKGEKTKVSMGVLVEEVLNLIRSALPKNIDLKQIIPPLNLPQISADASQIHSVLMNLCTNAMNAMAKGGVLEVRLRDENLEDFEISSGGRISGRFICLEVGDNGAGIDQDNLSRIFEPFFTTKEVGEGTGLGLSTVFGIVEEHGGYISVASEIDKGTTFQVFLPILPA